jgi:hypothetical protein
MYHLIAAWKSVKRLQIHQLQGMDSVSSSLSYYLTKGEIYATDRLGNIAFERGVATLALNHFTTHKEVMESHGRYEQRCPTWIRCLS